MSKPEALYFKKDDDDIQTLIFKTNFRDWYQMLLTCNMTHNRNLGCHPLDSCAERDVIRDREVKNALYLAFVNNDPWNSLETASDCVEKI